MEENEKRTKAISTQFRNELIELADRTEKEIQQMLDDYVGAFRSRFGKQPKLVEYLDNYDNLMIIVIQNLLNIRTRKRLKHLKRRKAELEGRREKRD